MFRRSFFAAAAAVLTAVPAYANGIPLAWSANATSCVPDAASIEFNRYTTANGRVAHRPNNVDPIQLNCGISDFSVFVGASHWKLVITYRDSTGVQDSAAVIARLVRISRVNGSTAGMVTFNSNSNEGSGIDSVGKASISFDHVFNFDNNYYVIQLLLDRTLTSEIVEVSGVAIEEIQM
jgi:hypothetical protein